MARNTPIRLSLTGTLVARTPLHVGGLGGDPDTDLPLATDGRGRWYVPGTSLAGALRGWCEQVFHEAVVRAVWGYQQDDQGHASFITVEDAVLPDVAEPEFRDGVGIDRRTGAAAEHIKYDRAVLPRGTRLPLVLSADVDDDRRTPVLAMIAELMAALAGERLRLGAAKTRGLGRVALEDAVITERDIGTRAGVLAWLKGGAGAGGRGVGQDELQAARDALNPRTRPRLDVTIRWRPAGPLMVKAGADGVAMDMLPLVSEVEGGVVPVLPGSSIKGALRTAAERVVRTVRRDLPAATDDFLADTNVPLVNDLFGAREDGVSAHSDAGHLGQAALVADECYAVGPVPRGRWDAVATATDDRQLRAALDAVPVFKEWQPGFHVAIDRWTGGAAESFLYTVLEPHAVAWEPITLTLDLGRLPAAVRPACVGLLVHVLRDLARGDVPLGFAVNRGMGAVAVDAITVEASDVAGIAGLTGRVEVCVGGRFRLPDELRTALGAAWAACIERLTPTHGEVAHAR